ncbi:YraN family protein [Devosia sp.]|uniref:YraN family protein n=1 Tax=Devosia sp. TaxID=1871048 RepID=UPI003265F813
MPPSPSKPKSKARLKAYRGGHWGETLAALFLQAKLYRIIDRRFKSPVGEIDLVAQRFGITVFVEVKARTHASGEAEALAAVNQQRIIRAAQYYIARHPHLAQTPLRFDVIFLARRAWPRHVINAFDASRP